MKKSYIAAIRRIFMLLFFIAVSLGLYAESSDVFCGTQKIVVKQSSNTSRNVKYTVTGEDIISVDVSEFYYIDLDDNTHEVKKSVDFYQNGDSNSKWEASYACKKNAYGEYIMTVDVTYGDGSIESLNTGSFEYKPKNNIKKDTVKIEAAPRQAYIPDIGTFKSYYVIDKTDKEIFVKTGETINVDILYRAADKKLVNSSNVKLRWGNKSISPVSIKAQSKKDTDGLYNIGAKFRITANEDMDGELTAVYEGSKKTSRSLGIKVDADGTAPKFKIAGEYLKGKMLYFNKQVSVPITITEKNFVEDKVDVKVNGKNVNPVWVNNDDKHTTEIKLKDGSNVIEITGTDKTGNKADSVKSANIVIDKVSPKIVIEGFENGTGKGLQNGEVVPFPVTVTVNDEISLNDASVALSLISADGTAVPVEMQVSDEQNKRIYSIPDLEADGYYTLTVTASDSAGNLPVQENIISEGETPYTLENGIISGKFSVNRKGSLYKVDNDDIFTKPLNESTDVIIFEYNKNQITECNITVVDSVGTTQLTTDRYTFEEVTSDEPEYNHEYKYTILKDNFDEGYYSIQIDSKSIAGENGSLITRTKESSSINKTLVIDKTPPEVILYEGTDDGDIRVKIRDNNMDISSAKLVLEGKEYNLQMDEPESTSTNLIYTASINKNPEKAMVVCKDLAGNETQGSGIVIKETSNLSNILMFAGLAVAVIVLLVVTIVIIIRIRKRKWM